MCGRFSYCFKRKDRSFSLNKNIVKTINYLFYYHPLTLKTFSFMTSNSVDKGLKNNYIISIKTSINNDKTIYKKQVCNQQEIN